MKAIGLIPGTTALRIFDRPEPSISKPDEIKMRVVRVGICGTDREEASGGRCLAPEGRQELVVGHEMLGRVVEAGRDVKRVKPGDYAVFTVRRGCGNCLPCAMNRSDMCRTGKYRERGIWGLDGYQTQFVVDKEQYVVRVPAELEPIGVLTEPLTIAEKAIDEAVRLQFARLPDALASPDWFVGRRCLVAGLGPVGLLAAMALKLRGAQVYGLDIVDSQSPRAKWLSTIGGSYINGRQVRLGGAQDTIEPMDLIFEAAGIPKLEFNLLDTLDLNGIYLITGIPAGNRPLEIHGAQLIRRLVLGNQLMAGSVNAARSHFQMAVDDLARAYRRWSNHISGLITHRFTHEEFAEALGRHPQDEIKAVVEWTAA